METLAGLAVGEHGVVADVGKGARARRLMALGFVPGTSLRVVRVSPLGDPIEYEVRGARVSIRRSEASVILVRALRSAP